MVRQMSSTSVDDAGLPFPRRIWAIVALVLMIIILVSNNTSITVALPVMARDFGVSPTSAIWVVNGFQLAVVVTMLPLSALGHRFGHRLLFQCGLGVFIGGAALCSVAGCLSVLVGARFLQGVGAAAMMSVVGALIRDIYPPSRLGTALSINALTVAVSGGLGPVFGSLILTFATWPFLFLVIAPVGLVALAMSFALPPNEPRAWPFDGKGAVINAVAFGSFVIGVMEITNRGELALVAILASSAAFILLVRHIRTIDHPIIPLDLLTIPRMYFASTSSILCFSCSAIVLTALPFYLGHNLQLSHIEVGFALAVWPAAVGIAAVFSGWLSDRILPELLCMIGSSILACGTLFILLVPVHSAAWTMPIAMGVAGLGFGIFQAPNNRVLLGTVPHDRSAGASVIQAMSREFGNAVGAGILSLAFSIAVREGAFVGLIVGTLLAGLAAALNVIRLYVGKNHDS